MVMKRILIPLLLATSLASAFAESPADAMNRKIQNWQTLKNTQSTVGRPNFSVNEYDHSLKPTTTTSSGSSSPNGSGGTTGTVASPTWGGAAGGAGTGGTASTPPNGRTGTGAHCSETVCTNATQPSADLLLIAAERAKQTAAALTSLTDLPNAESYATAAINTKYKNMSLESAIAAIMDGSRISELEEIRVLSSTTYQEYLSKVQGQEDLIYTETYWALARSFREKVNALNETYATTRLTDQQLVDAAMTLNMFETYEKLRDCKAARLCIYKN